jgi:PAS domain-containing protein
MDYNSLSKHQLVRILEDIRSSRYLRLGSDELEPVRILKALLLERLELDAENQTLRDSAQLIEASLREYLNLFEMAPLAYVLLDTNGCVVKMNQLACMLVHKDATAMTGLRFSGVLTEDSRRLFLDHFTDCRRFKNVARTVALDLDAETTGSSITMTGSWSDRYRGLFVSAA